VTGTSPVTSTVQPSGAALATAAVPIELAAPVRFSTTTGWPSRCETAAATSRPMRSTPPPAGNDTMKRTAVDTRAAATAPTNRARKKERFMPTPP
jgi:hypothetical protein